MVTVPENVTLSGPTSGMPYSTHTFTASVGPITTTTPITYVWEATGQLPMTTTADLTGTATFNWSAGGEQVITVTAANAAGMVSDTHGINIEHVPPREIIISGPTTGVVNTVYTFTATVGPGTVTMPITYTWTPAPNSGQGTAVVDFTWAITGDKTITVTAENISGTASYAVSDTHVIAIREPYHIYLPLTLRHWSPPPDPDQYEPNDTMDTAFVLPVATSVTATDLNFVPSYVDQDWFAFYVKTGQLYQASTSNLVGVDTYLAVYDVAGDQVTADDNGGGGFASKTEWQATHVGYYYIEVTNLTASSTPWNTYDLSVEEAVPIAPTSTLTSALTIAQVEWNPPGPDLEGEYVMITNRGEDIQDMTGWTLSDADYHTYSFPTSFFLCSKCSVRVWTKSGTDVVTNLYWGRSSAVWDNTGDCAYLRDGAGTLVDSYCY